MQFIIGFEDGYYLCEVTPKAKTPFMTVKQAAEASGKSRQGIEKLAKSGKLVSSVDINGQRIVSLEG